MARDELEFVSWLARQSKTPPSVPLGIGDDMAVLRAGGGVILIGTDMLLDGVHFDRRYHGFEQIGRKAMACALSDCAAMAVRPIAAAVSLALPRNVSMQDAQLLMRGCQTLAEQFNATIAGGDTTRWDHALAVDVAIVAADGGRKPITRAGARIADTLYVTGRLGGSLLGHHIDFTPRIHEAEALARSLGDRLHAMMDISDGLAIDLWRMCQASGVGAELCEHRLGGVASHAAVEASQLDGRSPVLHALTDGEDFELLFAAAGPVCVEGAAALPVGEIVADGFRIRSVDGRLRDLNADGYIH